MPERTISQTFKVGGVLTNADSAKLSDPTATFGVKRNDTDAVVVADNTAMNNPSTGVYTYTFTAIVNVSYTAYIEFVFDGDTIFVQFDIPAVSDDFGMVVSYDSLLSRVGFYLFGIRTGYTTEQTDDIRDCIQDGLHDVYTAHRWSFFTPVQDITTTAPYTTGTISVADGVVTLVGGTFPTWAAHGLLKVDSRYFSVSSRDGDTQLTLTDLSLDGLVAETYELGRPEVPLDDSFEAVANDSDLTYYPSHNEYFPPIKQRGDQFIRAQQQLNPLYNRPYFYSVRTVLFDPEVGSRKRLAFYPVPDAAYVLRVPMILRPTMIDTNNQYPVGGETLAQVILEACLAAAERNFDEKEATHRRRFMELLPLAIQADAEKSTPTSLGRDMPKGERNWRGCYDSDYARAARIGAVSLDGTEM